MEIENQSINFILPMLGSDCRYIDAAFGVFIGDDVKKKNEQNKIFLLCDSEDNYYINKKDNFVNHHLLLDSYNYDKYDMYMFNVPELLIKDYQAFKEGRYSDFSNEYKNHIRKFYYPRQSNIKIVKNPEFSLINDPLNIIKYKEYIDQVITKSEKLYNRIEELFLAKLPRTIEILHPPDMEDEIFTEKTLKKILNLGEIEKWI